MSCSRSQHSGAARVEPAAPRSRVKHYTTEPLRSYVEFVIERLQAGSRPAASVVLLSRSKKRIKGQNFCQMIDYLSFHRFYQSIKRQICHYFITFSCATFCINKTARCRRNKQDLTGKISFLRTFQVDLLVHFEENGCNKIVYTLKFTGSAI